jgi:hypothetical protein
MPGFWSISRNCRGAEGGSRANPEKTDDKVITKDTVVGASPVAKDSYLLLEVNGAKESCLLDTGSDQSINQNTFITCRRSQANQRRVMTMTRSETRVHMQQKTIRFLTVV